MNVDDGMTLFEERVREAWWPVFEMNENNCFACSDENCPCTSVHVCSPLKAPFKETYQTGDHNVWIIVDYRETRGGFDTFAVITDVGDQKVEIPLESRFVSMPHHLM